MSNRMQSLVWDCEELRGTRLLLMLGLADWADDDGLCFPKQNTIAAKTRISRATVQRHLVDLERDGLLFVDRSGNAQGRASRYWLTLPQNEVRLPDPASICGDPHITGEATLASTVRQQDTSNTHQRNYALTRAASRRATPEEAQRAAVENGLPWLCHQTHEWRKPGDAKYLVCLDGKADASEQTA